MSHDFKIGNRVRVVCFDCPFTGDEGSVISLHGVRTNGIEGLEVELDCMPEYGPFVFEPKELQLIANAEAPCDIGDLIVQRMKAGK